MTLATQRETATEVMHIVSEQSDLLQTASMAHAERSTEVAQTTAQDVALRMKNINDAFVETLGSRGIAAAWSDYSRDAAQRWVMFVDALRQRGALLTQRNKDYGAKPVLIYDSEKVMDGKDMPRPCCYFLLKIVPPEGIDIDETKRPYVIIDPRAGHGAGIGGFKFDSQVGVALKAGHPVYFVAFRQMPEPGQTLAMVTEAEAAFLREIEKRHPDSPKPVVIGNCQGGWATAILAATNPDLIGPIVLNGSPMSYWGGKVGQDPMRYSGGLAGGALPAKISGDAAGGIFEGADLVMNFEALSAGRKWFGEYFELYQDPSDHAIKRFLDFEKWWGAFHLMTTDEISWIVENLFVGNRLSRNQAQLEPGNPIDLKQIRAPIICFASHGDNITPPAQALNWIIDTYTNEQEIEIRGQRILYMLHDQTGHLGIFVSSKIANREHSQMAETLANIEALPPGLYEIVIEDVQGENHELSFKLSIAQRKFADIISQTGNRMDEAAFAGVARASEQMVETYDATLRPMVQAMASPELGEMRRQTHPMRVVREMVGGGLPGMSMVQALAENAHQSHVPLPADNPFRQVESLWGKMVEASINMMVEAKSTATELAFFSIWASPVAMMYGKGRNLERTRKDPELLAHSPEVQIELNKMEIGNYAEGLLRMLILVAGSRGDTRGDRLARSQEVLNTKPPFKDLAPYQRTRMIHQQTVIAHFAPEAALETLPKLLRTKADRQKAFDVLSYVVGSEDEMAQATKDMIARFRKVLALDPETTDTPSSVVPAAE